MDELLKKMYTDAMILDDINAMEYEASLNNAENIVFTWQRISEHLQRLIEELGAVDLQSAKQLLSVWKEVGENTEDYRELTAGISYSLRPAILAALNILYNAPLEIDTANWRIEKTPVCFLTLKEKNSNRYIHSPYDPMKEARVLADRLYSIDMTEFHILGSGLGYLAYQLWIKSGKTLKVIIYEDDIFLRQAACSIGVLSWMEGGYEMPEYSSPNEMLRDFVGKEGKAQTGIYVQDWKEGAYRDTDNGENTDRISCNMRMERLYGAMWAANRRSNLQKDFSAISDLKRNISVKRNIAVVSAGPSLNDNIEFLKKHKENLLIIAVNSSLKRIAAEGIKADISVMLDPAPKTERYLDNIEDYTEDIPMITVSNGSRAYIDRYRGKMYLITDEEYGRDSAGYVWSFGGTVASLGLDVAFFLGAENIFLIGNDLGFPGGKNYAAGLAHAEKEGMVGEMLNNPVTKSVDGGEIYTTVLYESYRHILESQICRHPEAKVYNMSRHGAIIDGALGVQDAELAIM